ncbi:MAG: hypothetical protein AMXMBFR13_30080 [Phycisphaerae bacterium]
MQSGPEPARQPRLWVPAFVLALGILLTVVMTGLLLSMARARDAARFEHLVEQTANGVKSHLDTYVALLRGAQGLFAASEQVYREEFRAYVDRLDLPQRYPGIQGIGFTRRLAPADVAEFINSQRAVGLDRFRVWPENERPEYHTIVYLEPLDRRNQAAIGFDMFTEPTRRAAMEQARDTALPAASGRVVLVQEIDPQKQPGFLIYLPVYNGREVPKTVQQRQEALRGFVYSPFRAHDLLEKIVGPGLQSTIAFEVYDGPAPAPDSLLYATAGAAAAQKDPGALSRQISLDVAGRPWTFLFFARPLFVNRWQRELAYWALVGGLAVSFLLYGLTRLQARARRQAEAHASVIQHSQDALRRSEERYRTLVSQVRDYAIFMTDAGGRTTSWNEGVLRVLGYDEAEFIGMSAGQLFTPEDLRDGVPAREFEEAVQKGNASNDRWMMRKDGSRFWATGITSALRDRQGRLIGFTKVMRDLTDRKRAEDARARRTLLLALRADVITALTDTTGSMDEVLQHCTDAAARRLNAALVRLWAFNPETDLLVLKASSGIVTHTDGAHARIGLGRLKIGRIGQERRAHISQDLPNDPEVSDREWIRAQGLAAFAGFPLLIENRLIGVLAVFSREPVAEDVLDALGSLAELLAQGIERRRTQEALRESEERFRATFNQAAAGITLIGIEGRYLQVNERFCEITGYSPVDLARMTWQELTHPQDRAVNAELHRRLLAGELPIYSIEKRYVCKGNRIAWVSMSASAVRDPQGHPLYTISVVRDITARRQAEQALRDQKQEMEVFLSIVAHDLKHPVVSMQGLLGLLRKQAAGMLDAEARENLEMSLVECNRMKDIIAQLGHIAQIGTTQIRPEPVHLRRLLEKVVQRFRQVIEEKQAEVSIQAADDVAIFSRAQVEEALDNLVDNALRYGCPKTGCPLQLSAEMTDGQVQLSVADRGPGIHPRYHARIFEIFRRLEPDADVPGSGVGLTAVERLIKHIGGTVRLDSAPSQGARFTLRFPASEPQGGNQA